ncbi:MAG: DUF2796 domain-containing protein [Alteromonadaceae bacterium]|nr:DUF2796 domain-containing protein [Alteromonadaceae bacterium]
MKSTNPKFQLTCGVLAILGITLLQPATAAGAKHVHGQGSLLVAQDADRWQLEFSLPASDVIGFEHAPHSKADRSRLHAVERQLVLPSSVFVVDNDNCEVTDQTVSLPHSSKKQHDEHEDDHDDEHDDHHGDHDESTHSEVTLRYELLCSEPLQTIKVTIFDIAPSLTDIDVQWVTNKGQGKREITPMQQEIVW